MQHIRTVANSKKRFVFSIYELRVSENPRHVSTRRTSTLFHYKLYEAQMPLKLPQSSFEKIVDAVSDPSCSSHIQSLGLKILIKVFLFLDYFSNTFLVDYYRYLLPKYYNRILRFTFLSN